MSIRHLCIRPPAASPTRRPAAQVCIVALLLSPAMDCQSVLASPHKIDDYHWDQVDRVVAIGDVHGDYGNYIKALEGAGIINARGQWIGGETHLVQLGDIP